MKSELKKLVAQEELDKALSILLEHLEQQNNHLYNVGVHLSARYKQWKEKTLKGIQESQQEIHMIRDGLLQLIDQIDGTPDISQTGNKSRTVVDKIKLEFGLSSQEAALLFYHLGSTKYEWRNQSTLMEKTGWSAPEIDQIARFYPEQIKRGKRADGTIIFRLNPPWRQEIKGLLR